MRQTLLERFEVDIAGAHDSRRVGVIDKGEKQMLKRGEFVLALIRISDGPMQGFFQITRKRGQ